MKHLLIVTCASLLLCGACKSYRNTSIFDTIPESELLSKASNDSLFLEVYQSIDSDRDVINQWSLKQKSQFASLTYGDFCQEVQYFRNLDSTKLHKYYKEWKTLYEDDMLVCSNLILYYLTICDWDKLSAQLSAKERDLLRSDMQIACWETATGAPDDILKHMFVPQVLHDYLAFWGLISKGLITTDSPINLEKELINDLTYLTDGKIVRALINLDYLSYNEYYRYREFPQNFEFAKLLAPHLFPKYLETMRPNAKYPLFDPKASFNNL